MPQLQVVDTTRDKPDPTGIEQFFSRLGKDYKDRSDQQEIGNILSEYKNNRQDANAWEDMQLKLQESNISPTKRLEAQQGLNNMKKTIIAKDAAINKQTKEMESQAAKQKALDLKEADRMKKEEDAIMKAEKSANEVKEILINSGEDPEEAERLAPLLSVSSANARVREKNAFKKIDAKKSEKKEETDKSQRITQTAFNEIAKLIPKVGTAKSSITFGGKDAKNKGQFTSMTGALESHLVEMVSKGKLSDTRFNYITKDLLPKPTDSQNTIRGKMTGLAIILDLDPSALGEEGTQKENKVPEGKVRVKVKGSNPPVYGSVTPYEGMEAKYDRID